MWKKIQNPKTKETKFVLRQTEIPSGWELVGDNYSSPSDTGAPGSQPAETPAETPAEKPWQSSKTAEKVDRAYIRSMYHEYLNRDPSLEELSAWEDWGAQEENADHYNKDDFVPVFRAASQTELAAMDETPAATAAFEETDDMKAMRENIQKTLDAGVPELTPEMVTQWQPYLQAMAEPYEQQAVTGLREEANLLSPYSIGSGSQVKATSDMLTKFAANKMATALALGQADYGNKMSLYTNALSRQGSLAGVTNENEWKEIQRKWALEDADTARSQALQDQSTQQSYAKDLAEMYRPSTKQWWEYILEPVATGVGAGLAGPYGAAAGQGLSRWITES